MSIRRPVLLAALTAILYGALSSPNTARAQLTMVESGFVCVTLSNDLAKQVEIGIGPDTCLYYGSFDGLKKRCGPFDPDVVCDPSLSFPVGIAFSTSGVFGNYMYIADYGLGGIYRSSGCGTASPFASISGPGSIAFPPSGSAYGNYLYACDAYTGPIYRVSSTGTVTTWLALDTIYLRFGPGGTWGSELYATQVATFGQGKIVRVSSTGTITTVVSGFGTAEGFDWGFDGDLFATDVSTGQIFRVKPNGTKTLFATLPGAADVAYRAAEQSLYAVSNQGGFYRIFPGSGAGVPGASHTGLSFSVAPSPTRGPCQLRFSLPAGGLVRAQVVDAAGRMVWRAPESWRPAGNQSIEWDGRDGAGTPVQSGVYFARLSAAGEARSARMLVVR